MIATALNQQVEKLLHYASFRGVRHILDEQAFDILTSKQTLTNFTLLNHFTEEKKQRLVFEVQMPLNDSLSVTALCDVIRNNKNISFIINHAGFPTAEIGSTEWINWQNNLTKLAFFENVAIKCSGWEMVDRQYNRQQNWLNRNLETCFTVFGEKRMMLASNFPLCLFTHSQLSRLLAISTQYESFYANKKYPRKKRIVLPQCASLLSVTLLTFL